MTFNYYQLKALETAINRNGKNELFHLALGLAGETGEVMEKLKKAVRDNESVITEEMKQDLEKLADRQRRNKLSGSGDNR